MYAQHVKVIIYFFLLMRQTKFRAKSEEMYLRNTFKKMCTKNHYKIIGYFFKNHEDKASLTFQR